MQKKIEENWLKHVSIDKFPFPRDIGKSPAIPWRVSARTTREYLSIIRENINSLNLYVAVFSDWQIRNKIFNKIYLDFDKEDNLSEVYQEVRKTAKYIEDKYGALPRIYFSGRKGFHIFLDFEPYVFKHYREVSREYVNNIIRILNLKTLDIHSVGDVRRVSRLVYSINFGSNRLCIPIDIDWDINEILWQSKNCELKVNVNVLPLDGFGEELIEIDNSYDEYLCSRVAKDADKIIGQDSEKYLSDLKLILDMAGNGLDDFRHRLIHFAIVPRLVWIGKTDQEILDFCQKFILKSSQNNRKSLEEYERHTIQSIKRTREGGWMPWSWRALLYYYPDLKKYLERIK